MKHLHSKYMLCATALILLGGTAIPNIVHAQGAVISAQEQRDHNLNSSNRNSGSREENFLEAVEVDTYFDSQDLTPNVGSDAAPDYELRLIDPEEEKAQRFVIVDKEANANSANAGMVSAKRAMDLGRYDAAMEIYKKLLRDTPSDPNILIGYAAALQKAGDVDRAIAAYDKVLQLEPNNTDAHVNMLGLVGERYPAVALQRLKALEKKVGVFNPSIVGQIAFVQAKLGHHDAALDSYANLASREPDNAMHVLNMAIVADKAGMSDAAVMYYEEALELDTIYGGGSSFDRKQVFDRLAQIR